MFEELGMDPPLDDALQLLQELEVNRPDEVRKQRTHARHQISIEMIIRPANSSERHSFEIRGTTADISEGGCQALLPAPCTVGDLYLVEFARGEFELPQVFVRCRRCRLIREDAFETGFSFFAPITLPVTLLT